MRTLDDIARRCYRPTDGYGFHNRKKRILGGNSSCARKEERPDSDVDLLVKFGSGIGLVEYVRFERELSHLLGLKVELTVNSALLREPRFADRVCREAVAI